MDLFCGVPPSTARRGWGLRVVVGRPLCVFRAHLTEVVRNVGRLQILACSAATNPSIYIPWSALVWDPSASTITECRTATVHDEIFGSKQQQLCCRTPLRALAPTPLARYRGVAAGSNHPTSGERPGMDDRTNRFVIPEGAKPSKIHWKVLAHRGFRRGEKLVWWFRRRGRSYLRGYLSAVPCQR